MTEAMDMDGRLDQLVRAGLMPTSSLPLLKRAISRMHAGMSLQGAERDVMNMFISSMMFIVLGDDTVFNKARAGAKGYAAEEVDMGQAERGMRSSSRHTGGYHVVDKAGKVVSKHANQGAAMRAALENDDHRVKAIKEAKEKTEYDYEGDMAMGQLKSIIANSQRMHDMLSEDTNLPEWVQSKITLAEDYITTASNYMQGEMNESKDGMPFDGPYRKVGERKDKYGNPVKNVAKHLAKKAMNAQKNEEVEQIDEILPLVAGAAARYAAGKAGAGVVGRTVAGAATKYAVSKSMNKEEVEQVDEISSDMAHRYLKGKRERDYDISADGKSSKLKKPQSFAKMNKDVKSSMRALRTIEKSKKTNEETEQVDEVSKATMGRYINKAKDSIDMTSYRSGIKDGTAISSSTPYKSNNPLEKKLTKRHKGISMAVKKLTKEDIDAVKHMNESYKTAFETALNEYGIKSPSELDESKRKEFFNHVDLEFKKGDN
jgi:predicted transcriptional regulator